MSVIKINGLTRDYGNKKGIFDVTFDIQKGEVFGFLGPNGAGKTTTIRHLMGFSNALQGSCTINGLDCRKDTEIIQKDLGYIPGEISFMDEMTGIQFIEFIAKYRGLHDMRKAHELMQRFELDPKGKIKKMSKGMKQKIGIVCAFMHNPDVLILDEPTSGLDPLMQNKFVELILEEKKKGKTILMSSHMFEEVERTCDRVGIIKDGHIVSIDDVEKLKKTKQKMYIVEFSSEEEANAFVKEGFHVRHQSGASVTIRIQKDLAKFLQTLPNYAVQNLDVVQQSLEEVFMHFYGGSK